jgi:hypothetical protein
MPDDFEFASPDRTDDQNLIEAELKASEIPLLREVAKGRYEVPEHIVKSVANIATNIWKAKVKMLDTSSGEVREEMKRVYRHVEAAFEGLGEVGLEVQDHTGQAFDYGLPTKVITAQPTQGITRESVIETIKPTIYWRHQLIQVGEVVIATPATPNPTV